MAAKEIQIIQGLSPPLTSTYPQTTVHQETSFKTILPLPVIKSSM